MSTSTQQVRDTFEKIYHKEPDDVAFSPYRICPIGAHSDHQFGKITGFAIEQGIHMAYSVKHNGIIELSSMNFEKRAQWHCNQTPPKQFDWADYLRGATLALAKVRPLNVGLSGVIKGDLPIGGLSSSAAVIITFLQALCAVNQIKLTEKEMIEVALDAEKNYVGVTIGTLDQSCEIYSRKDAMLYLDTLDDSYELIPNSPNLKPFEIAIFFSGLERSLAGSKYNMRVDEMRSAGYACMAYEGMEYGKFEEVRLRHVPREVFDKYKDRLPEQWRRRATHYYTEFERVEKGAEAWRKGDIEEYGRLSFASGQSSIENYETGSPELIRLYEIMKETDGIYGGRFSGAGFKGCCMALIDPAYKESILESVGRKYLETFPNLEGKYASFISHIADGVKL